MNIDQLGIADTALAVSLTLDNTERGLIARESLVNAAEAPADLNEKIRDIRVRKVPVYTFYEDGTHEAWPGEKLCVFNTCRGLTAEELIKVTDLTSTLAKEGSAKKNRGEGLKVAAAKFNPKGIRIRSGRDGEISEVVIVCQDGVYGRETFKDEDGRDAPVSAPFLTPDEVAFYAQFATGWFEVVFLGRDEAHDTWSDPYGDGVHSNAAFPFEAFARFYRMPRHPTLETTYRFDHAYRSSGHNAFYPLSDFVHDAAWIKQGDVVAVETVNAVGHPGVTITYIQTQPDREGRSPYRTRSVGRDDRIAIEWKGELYGTLMNKNTGQRQVGESGVWSRNASLFGLPGLGKVLSVIIHLPDDYAVSDDRYRFDLVRIDQSRLYPEFFSQAVVNSRPEWVRRLCEQNVQSVGSDVKKRIQEALDRLGSVAPVASEPGSTVVKNTTTKTGTRTTTTTDKTPVKPRAKSTNAAASGRHRVAAPEIKWTTADVEPNLRNKGAFYAETTNILYMNQDYDTLVGTTAMVLQSGNMPPATDEVSDFIKERVQDHASFIVGYTVGKTRHRSGLDGWGTNETSRALSSEALTAVFDTIENDLSQIKDLFVHNERWRAMKAAAIAEDSLADAA